jgi:hypothetical protein
MSKTLTEAIKHIQQGLKLIEKYEKKLKKLTNREKFINNWLHKYYDKDADDEDGNIQYLTAEAEQEYDMTIGLDEWAGSQMY